GVSWREALDQESRTDKAQRRQQKQRQAEELRAVEERCARIERRLAALERLRRVVCRALMLKLQQTYVLTNAKGQTRELPELFGGAAPWAGDCAAPKLLCAALREGLRPIALTEFWWGAPPSAGGRVEGAYYPACKDKCGPVLSFLLEGLE